ncbi:MAG: T9SS type A sorting domain-containing protein [Ignavibacteriae bacterium]|nr:T9SS type A sorting domain-containing protein [Ignavibacteriota bacterium]
MVSRGATFAVPNVVDDTVLVDTSRTTIALNPNTWYIWRVQALFDSLEGRASQARSFDTRTNGTVEFFPLGKGIRYLYAYSRSYYYAYGGKEWDVDSGTVSYDIMDGSYSNDTTRVWTISEKTSLMHHHWSENVLGTVLHDSTYWQTSTSPISLTESLTGNHELLCQSRVWFFPQLPDSQPVPQWSGREPVYRFWQDTSRTLKQYQQPPDPDRYQSLHFVEQKGLADRTYFFRSSGNHVTIISETAVHVPILTGADHLVPPTHPEASILSQNYPNPFNPSTTIRYGLPARSHVTLTVFNTLGQQVAALQNGEQDAGYHEAIFNADRLPSGVYFYTLQVRPLDAVPGRDSNGGTEVFTETKRSLLIR